MTSHLEEGILHELLDGEIPSSELPPIQAHLAGCAECRGRLEEARGFQSVSDRLIEVLDLPGPAPERPEAAPVPVHRFPWRRNLAWAATIVAAAGIGYYGGRDNAPAPLVDARMTIPTATPELPANPGDSGVANPRAAAPATQPVPPARQNVVADRPAERDAAQEKKEAPGKAKAPENESARRDEVTARSDVAPTVRPNPAPPPAGTATAAARVEPAGLAAAGERRMRPLAEPRAQSPEALGMVGALKVQNQLAGGSTAPERIELSEAVRRLGGALRLIEGLVPDHLEALGQEVRVVYPLASGELLLRQQLIDGRITFRLTAPAGFPADSLERLKARVRE